MMTADAAQWIGPRRSDFHSFASRAGPPPAAFGVTDRLMSGNRIALVFGMMARFAVVIGTPTRKVWAYRYPATNGPRTGHGLSRVHVRGPGSRVDEPSQRVGRPRRGGLKAGR